MSDAEIKLCMENLACHPLGGDPAMLEPPSVDSIGQSIQDLARPLREQLNAVEDALELNRQERMKLVGQKKRLAGVLGQITPVAQRKAQGKMRNDERRALNPMKRQRVRE